VAETLQKLFPLFPLGRRIRLFASNLGPPASKDESEIIISHFGGDGKKNQMAGDTDEHDFHIRKRFKDKRLNGTRMNADKHV
jgi:hypothetical protein